MSQSKPIHSTWAICTQRVGKLHRARSRLYRTSQSLEVIHFILFSRRLNSDGPAAALPKSTRMGGLDALNALNAPVPLRRPDHASVQLAGQLALQPAGLPSQQKPPELPQISTVQLAGQLAEQLAGQLAVKLTVQLAKSETRCKASKT